VQSTSTRTYPNSVIIAVMNNLSAISRLRPPPRYDQRFDPAAQSTKVRSWREPNLFLVWERKGISGPSHRVVSSVIVSCTTRVHVVARSSSPEWPSRLPMGVRPDRSFGIASRSKRGKTKLTQP
jgi:hypothetical protein